MGTWGSGNFENDGANDYLVSLLDSLIMEVGTMLNSQSFENDDSLDVDDGDHKIIPAIDIYITLSEKYDTPPRVDREKAKNWRQTYLTAFDKDTAVYHGNFKLERRRMIKETFDRLDELIRSWPNNP